MANSADSTFGNGFASIATDKKGYPHNIFLILDENICCGYSLEAPHQGASNEYQQHMFSLRNKKDISSFQMKKVPYLLLYICKVLPYFKILVSDNPTYRTLFFAA